MYVGRKYTATHTKGFDLVFECPRCRFESDTVVIGVGQGAGASPYFLDEEGAKERAQTAAGRAAAKNAEVTLALAPCPKCRHRRGLARFWIENLAGAAAVIVGFGLLAELVSHGRSSSSAWVIFSVTGTVFLGFAGYMRWILFSTSERRVIFLAARKEDEREAEPTRKKRKKKKPKPAAGAAESSD